MNDLISRQAAIDVIKTSRCLVNALKKTMKLPSAQPEPKTAHWVPLDERFSWSDYFKCSECGFRIKLKSVTDFGGQSVDCCPHCGAKMEEREMSYSTQIKSSIHGDEYYTLESGVNMIVPYIYRGGV